jgi:hypothetical protein
MIKKDLIRLGSGLLASLMLLIPITAMAEPIALTSAYQGWSTVIDAPELRHKNVSSSELAYRFLGSGDEGVFLSLHVSPLNYRNMTKKECRMHYQSKTSNISILDPQTIKIEELALLETMSYDAKIEYKNKVYDMPNTHFYFMLNGHCADLHVGASPTYTNFDQVVADIRSSIIKSSLSSQVLLSTHMEY